MAWQSRREESIDRGVERYEPFLPAVRDDPYPHYAALGERAPVYCAEEAQAWCISQYDDVQFVLRNAELFSSDAMRSMLIGARPGVNPIDDPVAMHRAMALMEAMPFALEELVTARNLISEDPPRHSTGPMASSLPAPARCAGPIPRQRNGRPNALHPRRRGRACESTE